jgi:hypothetical protein
MPCAQGKGVLASASAWAVRPSAASAGSVAAPAFFLPAWSHIGDHRCSPSDQEVMRPAHSSVGSMARVSAIHACRAWPANGRNSIARGWPNLKHQMPEVSTRRLRASGASSQSSSAVAVSRSGHPLAQPGSPNHSVKGTSRRRAAPYVER